MKIYKITLVIKPTSGNIAWMLHVMNNMLFIVTLWADTHDCNTLYKNVMRLNVLSQYLFIQANI